MIRLFETLISATLLGFVLLRFRRRAQGGGPGGQPVVVHVPTERLLSVHGITAIAAVIGVLVASASAWKAYGLADEQAKLLRQQVIVPAVQVRLDNGSGQPWSTVGRHEVAVFNVGAPVVDLEIAAEAAITVCGSMPRVRFYSRQVESDGALSASPPAWPPSAQADSTGCGDVVVSDYFDAPIYTHDGDGELARLSSPSWVVEANGDVVTRLRDELSRQPIHDGSTLTVEAVTVRLSVTYEDLTGLPYSDSYAITDGVLTRDDRGGTFLIDDATTALAGAGSSFGNWSTWVVAIEGEGSTIISPFHVGSVALADADAQHIVNWWTGLSSWTTFWTSSGSSPWILGDAAAPVPAAPSPEATDPVDG